MLFKAEGVSLSTAGDVGFAGVVFSWMPHPSIESVDAGEKQNQAISGENRICSFGRFSFRMTHGEKKSFFPRERAFREKCRKKERSRHNRKEDTMSISRRAFLKTGAAAAGALAAGLVMPKSGVAEGKRSWCMPHGRWTVIPCVGCMLWYAGI